MNIRVGLGYDVHRLVADRPLWLGGIRIDSPLGLLGHSDADVLLHALSDAILGAANCRDIGYHFPDTSPQYENADSKLLLAEVVRIVGRKGFSIVNVDATVCAEKPKLSPYIDPMRLCIASVLNIDADCVSVKATTTERLGFTGRQEGISAYAVVLLEKQS
ncbi:MAG: 2-C-methyl-D-erythritol 2,4-cyclodiphosphate synthase [Bacteroidaceae bacterium]|nr:2-C-methyl-D-erythritol 2,4-cyclodiphosphate synthase [Bacteroidaceae bacterium]